MRIPDPRVRGSGRAGSRLLPQFLGAIAELIRFLEQRLLPRRILLQVCLQAQQQVLVDQRFHVVVPERDRLVHGGHAGFELVEADEGFTIRLSYDTNQFKPETIARLLTDYEVLLQSVVEQPESRLLDIPILIQREKYAEGVR